MQSVRPQMNWGREVERKKTEGDSFCWSYETEIEGGIRVGEHRVVKSIQVGRPNLQEHRVGDFFPKQRPVGLVG
jgi:hypothetical protein